MEKHLKRTGWTSIISSIIFAIIGVILIYNPETTLKVISYALGIILIVTGISKAITYFVTKENIYFYNHELIYGLIAILIGIIIIYSNIIGTLFRFIIGIWIIYSGLMRLDLALKLKKSNTKVWLPTFLFAILIFVFGIYIFLTKGAIVVTIGIIILLYSIVDLIEGIIFMRNVDKLIG